MALDSRIQLSKLEIYCRVVELESVTKAASELFLSQPVVTTHVKSLQDRLGFKLLYRDRHAMRTTDAGQLAYEWAKDVLIRSEEFSRRLEGLADGSRGHAAVAASMTIGSYALPPLLARFRAQRPQVRIGLGIFDPERVVSEVESGAYDFGVLIADDSAVSTSSLIFEQIGEEEFVLVAGAAASIPPRISRAELLDLQLVGSPNHRVREHLLSGVLAANGIDPGEPAIELGHAEAMKRAVKETECASFLFSSSIEEELERGELRRVELIGTDHLTIPIFLAYRKTKSFSEMQQELLDVTRESFGAVVGAEASV